MKGVVFTEFLELVENNFGLDIADRIIDQAELSTGGAYTSVGTYDHSELVQLVVGLSAETNTPPATLVRAFGEYLFGRFAIGYPQFFTGITSTFDFLESIEDVIHVEVRKLYPDAELPTFAYQRTADQLVMTYRSKRAFADLAEGLIHACTQHFGEPIDIERENLDAADGTAARFTLTAKQPATVNV